MKKTDVYGVKMTSLEEMRFSKYRENNGAIAMNTISKKERFDIAKNWLVNYNNKKQWTKEKLKNTQTK